MGCDAFSLAPEELKFFGGLAEVFLLINLFFQLSQTLEFSHGTVSESHPSIPCLASTSNNLFYQVHLADSYKVPSDFKKF